MRILVNLYGWTTKNITQFQKVNKEKPEDKDSGLSIKLTKLALQIGKAGN